MEFFKTPSGRIFVSIIWGLGLAAFFRKSCKDRSCLLIRGPKPNKIKDKIYQFNNRCYTYLPYSVSCKKTGNIPV